MAARKRIAVLDYGSGNVQSAVNAFARLGADAELTRDYDAVFEADGLVVPGVGAYDAVMKALSAVQGPRMIGRRVAGNRPVLGICVGMQVLFDGGQEHGIRTQGMGEWPGEVTRLQAPTVPHMGWNTVRAAEGSQLFSGLEDERFYFVHSYGVQNWEFDQTQALMTPPQVSWAHHGTDFIAAVENGPLSATQFHPEKSADAGLQLLSNWMETL